jgi:virginiamycin A acetyltransferase
MNLAHVSADKQPTRFSAVSGQDSARNNGIAETIVSNYHIRSDDRVHEAERIADLPPFRPSSARRCECSESGGDDWAPPHDTVMPDLIPVDKLSEGGNTLRMNRNRPREARTLRHLIVRLYAIGRLRGLLLWVLRRLDGEIVGVRPRDGLRITGSYDHHSVTLREIFAKYWGVDVGMYTNGGCFVPWMVDEHTTIGRYSSIAAGVRIVNRNHSLSSKSSSGLFFNPAHHLSDRWLVDSNPLEVGSDVWIGANAVILPEVNRIGHGAVIGAGAVVSRDVPPYAVVLGNPARVVKYRFSPEVIEQLLAEEWWEKDIEEIADRIGEFQVPLEIAGQQVSGAAKVPSPGIDAAPR